MSVGKICAARVQLTRLRMGLTQVALAKATGLHETAVSHYESGTRRPSIDNLVALADALGVSTDYLLGRTEE